MKNEPIRALLAPIAVAAFVAAGQAFLAGADTRAIITAALGGLIVAAQELGRSLVTPTAPAKTVRGRRRAEAGYGVVDAILIVFLVAVVLIVLFHFA